MAVQPPQRFELDDLAHVEREARTIYAPGATPGDVLVVQSDHSLVAAPGGGAMPVEPPDIPGLALWLKADAIEGLSDGDPVALWPDSSDSGFDAAQATADNQPVYKAAIQNGLPVVRFDPTTHDQYLGLSGDGLDLVRDVPGLTVFVVGNSTPSAGGGVFFYASQAADPNDPRFVTEWTDISPPGVGVVAVPDGSGRLGALNIQLASVGTDLPVLAFVYDFLSGGVQIDSPEKGTLDSSYSGPTALGPTLDTASAVILVGHYSTLSLPGDIAELIVYQRALNAKERRELIEYLSVKWATL